MVGYEALTGRKPFARQTEGDTAEAVRQLIPPPASDINPAVSQVISRVMHKAMAKQPWHRFASAREFGETLQKAIHNQPIDMFDQAKIKPRIERSRKAFEEGDQQFASEILSELETEGHIDPDMGILRMQIDQGAAQEGGPPVAGERANAFGAGRDSAGAAKDSGDAANRSRKTRTRSGSRRISRSAAANARWRTGSVWCARTWAATTSPKRGRRWTRS